MRFASGLRRLRRPKDDDIPVPPDDLEGDGETGDAGDDVIIDPLPPVITDGPTSGSKKYYVGDVPVWVVAERVQYYGKDGKLITESLKDYTRKTVLEDRKVLRNDPLTHSAPRSRSWTSSAGKRSQRTDAGRAQTPW